MSPPTAAQYLASYFRQMRPGENDGWFVFEGPGTVVVALELSPLPNGDRPIKLLRVLEAKNDAMRIARTALASARPLEDGDYFFAFLGVIPGRDRNDAMEKLEAACKVGRAWAQRRKR
jgi:hypothetical protein